MKNSTNSITIGISALNEQDNIALLLNDLLKQDYTGVKLDRIIVISDGSTDQTVEEVARIGDGRIKIISGRVRKGKPYRISQITHQTNSDILVLLDADIRIKDRKFVYKLTRPIIKNKAELTSCQMTPLEPRNRLEQALKSSMKLKEILFERFKKSNNIYFCHGPATALAKKFYKQLNLNSEGDDMQSYLACISLGYRFMYVAQTEVYYLLPATLQDYLKQSYRFRESRKVFQDKIAHRELNIPVALYVVFFFRAFPYILTHLFQIIYYSIIMLISLFYGLKSHNLAQTWEAASTKHKLK